MNNVKNINFSTSGRSIYFFLKIQYQPPMCTKRLKSIRIFWAQVGKKWLNCVLLCNGFNFELGLFYSAGIHFRVSRIVGLAGWPIALIRSVLLGFEFQFSRFLVFLRSFLSSILVLSNVCYKNELFVNNCFVYLLNCFWQFNRPPNAP